MSLKFLGELVERSKAEEQKHSILNDRKSVSIISLVTRKLESVFTEPEVLMYDKLNEGIYNELETIAPKSHKGLMKYILDNFDFDVSSTEREDDVYSEVNSQYLKNISKSIADTFFEDIESNQDTLLTIARMNRTKLYISEEDYRNLLERIRSRNETVYQK